MPHCDPESIALMSLGEGVGTPEEDAHLATCRECQNELASLSGLVGVARSGGPIAVAQPSPDVWNRIRTEVGLAGPSATRPPTAAETPTPPPVVEDQAEPAESADQSDVAPVVSLQARRERRSRPATWLLAAAGIGGIVVGGAVTAAIVSSSQPSLTVAASVDLAPLPDWDAEGTAKLALNDAGQQVLVVSLDAAGAAGATGFQEVWLIDENVEGMVSLGILDGTSGEFVIPTGVDVGAFPIVDVSLEPFDGDPTHSGDSIARGQIEA